MALENLSHKYTKSTFLSEIQFCLTFLAVLGLKTTCMHQSIYLSEIRNSIHKYISFYFQTWMTIFGHPKKAQYLHSLKQWNNMYVSRKT